jgi:medium-chain acyl-[acyl-carrier-protein] hydrolase
MILDLGRKQPLKVDDILPDNFLVERRSLPDAFAALPALDRTDGERTFRVDAGHLDLNRHVNNTVYVGWALEAVPWETIRRRRPIDLEVAYRAEAFYDDPILSRVQAVPASDAPGADQEPVFLHQIANAATGAELTRLRTRWK